MKILEVLTYYRPHISGLTIYVERLSKALAKQGHQVTVFTSQYDKSLPSHEVKDGVRIRRVPVIMRVSKGVIMPRFGPLAWGMVAGADVVHLHLPQFDAPGVAFRGRLYGKPVVLTYHSDLELPGGALNRVINGTVHTMNRAAGTLADAVVTYTRDFGTHSPFLSRYLGKKLHVIPPPVELAPVSEVEIDSFRREHQLNGKHVIGISARLAAEKGIEVLLEALPRILSSHPNAHVLHASPDAIGEGAYVEHLRPLLRRYEASYHLLGALHGSTLTSFYRNLDCLVMCSLNNTETFGLVQVEAMMNGVPVVATDLPGVRQPARMTGMGEIVPVGDAAALAEAIVRILDNKQKYIRSAKTIAASFDPAGTAAEYIRLFNDLRQGKKVDTLPEPAAYGQLRQLRDSL
ncbi:MAG: glycosyltransferase family 4 protein [Chloroflexota bacterium]|nr:MAG: glycosyltransferase family 4 protein [Chloroflexota bacterium]